MTGNNWYAVNSLDTWLLAAIEQGTKARELHNLWVSDSWKSRGTGQDGHLTWSGWSAEESLLNQKQFDYTSTLFLIAINKANRWSKVVRKAVPQAGKSVDQFLAVAEPTKHVRDIREHDEEYFKGKGQRRDQLFHSMMNGQVQIDATSTYSDGQRILLGGRACVEDLLNAANELRQALKTLPRHHGSPVGGNLAEPRGSETSN